MHTVSPRPKSALTWGQYALIVAGDAASGVGMLSTMENVRPPNCILYLVNLTA